MGLVSSAPDVTVVNHGTIYAMRPETEESTKWLQDNLADDAQWIDGTVLVENRYAADIIIGMQNAGITIRGSRTVLNNRHE